MNCKQRLEEFLVANGVGFEEERHRLAYTAQDLAAAEHVSGKRVAKVVVAFVGRDLAMLVLSASSSVNIEKLKGELGVEDVRLAREAEFAAEFPDCEVGAMPPFGNLYGLPTYVDQALASAQEITFSAGSHTEAMRISYYDYERLVQPRIIDFAAKSRELVS